MALTDPPHEAPVASDWYAHAFDELYPIFYSHRDRASAAIEAAFALERTGLARGACALDLACGAGRHLLHLRKAGIRAMGLDYSAALLRQARKSLDDDTALVRGDMRALPLGIAFDAVFSFFTSFGYFFEAKDNIAVLREARRVLRSGGVLFLDHANKEYTIKRLEASSMRKAREWTVEEKRWFDARRQRVNKLTIARSAGGRVHRVEESVRLYEPNEFRALLAQVSFNVEAMYGDYDGAEVSANQPRTIIVARAA